jgi:hypothetical protein
LEHGEDHQGKEEAATGELMGEITLSLASKMNGRATNWRRRGKSSLLRHQFGGSGKNFPFLSFPLSSAAPSFQLHLLYRAFEPSTMYAGPSK